MTRASILGSSDCKLISFPNCVYMLVCFISSVVHSKNNFLDLDEWHSFHLRLPSAAAEADAIDPLINTLSSKRDGAVANAATVLTNMAMQEALRVSIQSRDIMHALIGPLHSSNMVVQSKAALTIAATACDAEARTEVSVFITFALIFLVITYGWNNVKTFSKVWTDPSFKSFKIDAMLWKTNRHSLAKHVSRTCRPAILFLSVYSQDKPCLHAPGSIVYHV